MEENKFRDLGDLKDPRFEVRFERLRFELTFLEDTVLPVNKVSALRGGMGEMLLSQNCVRDRECDLCDFESECIVRRTIYSRYEIQPSFANGNDSIGYVLECENYETDFPAGSRLVFYLLLFGKTIVYFSQFLMAFTALGAAGLGRECARFQITGVYNDRKQPILDGYTIYRQNYHISTLSEYIRFRKNRIRPGRVRLDLKAPVSLKYRGEMLRSFSAEAVTTASARRLYMLDCYEGIPTELDPRMIDMPVLIRQESVPSSVRRYSSTADGLMTLSGIRGFLELSQVSEEVLDLYLASELTHIGKNTSFGFGRVKVSQLP